MYYRLKDFINANWDRIPAGRNIRRDQCVLRKHDNLVITRPTVAVVRKARAIRDYRDTEFRVIAWPHPSLSHEIELSSKIAGNFPGSDAPGAIGTLRFSVGRFKTRLSRHKYKVVMEYGQTHYKTSPEYPGDPTVSREIADEHTRWRRPSLVHAIELAAQLGTVFLIDINSFDLQRHFHRVHPKFLTSFEKDLNAAVKQTGAQMVRDENHIVIRPASKK